MIILPKKRIIQPQTGVCLDRSNPLTAGALGVIVPTSPFNVVTGAPLVYAGTRASPALTSGGLAFNFNKDYYVETESLPAIGTGPFVEVWQGIGDGTLEAANPGLCGALSGASFGGIGILQGRSDDYPYLASNSIRIVDWDVVKDTGVNLVVGKLSTCVVVRDSVNIKFFLDGVKVLETASSMTTITAGTLMVGAFIEDAVNWTSQNKTLFAGRFSALWSDSTACWVSQDPKNIWSLLSPQKRRLLFKPAASSGSTGTSATTNANDTSSASGKTTIVGTSAKTNANDTSTASGKTTIVGTSATTNANDTSTASGKTTITGTSATTNANDTCTASGSVGSNIVGTSATTNANDTSTASGKTTIVGTSASTNVNDTSTASGNVGIKGSSTTTNANDTSTANGIAGAVTGTSATTNEPDTSNARGISGNPVVATSGGYYDVYTGRKKGKKESLPPRVLKKKLHKEEEKKEEILEIIDNNPGKLKFYAKDLKEIQAKIDALKEQINGKIEVQQDEQQQYHQNKRYEMIVRMLLLS